MIAAALVLSACGDDSVDVTVDSTVDGTAGDGTVGDGMVGACSPRAAEDKVDPGICSAGASDYAICEDDSWAACISDDGTYHRIQDSISSIARVAAFESIGDILFDATKSASADDFLSARMLYQEAEGLDSRVVRRYDPHFDAPADTDCEAEGVPAQHPDYCTGPAQIQPIILDAFMKGNDQDDVRRQAGRIEGALLRFFYVSTFKESLTCTAKAKDCDSAYAYYTGGETARGGLGLARIVNEVDPYAHDRAWDGLLALRCWRDLDNGEAAADPTMRDLARNQYDKALLHGVASIVKSRFDMMAAASADEKAYYWGFLQSLAPVLNRAMEDAAVASATELATELAKDDPATVDSTKANAAIDAVFDCP